VYLMDQVRQSEPDIAIDLPVLPPRVEVQGVAFVEFAADEAEAQLLKAHLRRMGFRLTARHRGKAVERFTQGEINVVINTEREGMAHSAYVTHGTSAYAMGLMVDDAAATVARAEALGAQLFSQRVGPDQLSIP